MCIHSEPQIMCPGCGCQFCFSCFYSAFELRNTLPLCPEEDCGVLWDSALISTQFTQAQCRQVEEKMKAQIHIRETYYTYMTGLNLLNREIFPVRNRYFLIVAEKLRELDMRRDQLIIIQREIGRKNAILNLMNEVVKSNYQPNSKLTSAGVTITSYGIHFDVKFIPLESPNIYTCVASKLSDKPNTLYNNFISRDNLTNMIRRKTEGVARLRKSLINYHIERNKILTWFQNEEYDVDVCRRLIAARKSYHVHSKTLKPSDFPNLTRIMDKILTMNSTTCKCGRRIEYLYNINYVICSRCSSAILPFTKTLVKTGDLISYYGRTWTLTPWFETDPFEAFFASRESPIPISGPEPFVCRLFKLGLPFDEVLMIYNLYCLVKAPRRFNPSKVDVEPLIRERVRFCLDIATSDQLYVISHKIYEQQRASVHFTAIAIMFCKSCMTIMTHLYNSPHTDCATHYICELRRLISLTNFHYQHVSRIFSVSSIPQVKNYIVDDSNCELWLKYQFRIASHIPPLTLRELDEQWSSLSQLIINTDHPVLKLTNLEP